MVTRKQTVKQLELVLTALEQQVKYVNGVGANCDALHAAIEDMSMQVAWYEKMSDDDYSQIRSEETE